MNFAFPSQPTNAMMLAFVGLLLGMWLLDLAYGNKLVRERMEKLGDERLIREWKQKETMAKIFGWLVVIACFVVLYSEVTV